MFGQDIGLDLGTATVIAYVKGKLDTKTNTFVVIDVQGIGYRIFTSGATMAEMPKISDEVMLYLEQIVREDFIGIYGFSTREELEMFKLLLSINGVGAKAALSLLSISRINNLRYAILMGDEKHLCRAPGIGKKTAEDHFFYFDVKNVGESTIVAKAGELTDESWINKVSEPNPDYILKEKGAVLNWFDITEVEGHLSLNSPFKDIMATLQGKMLVMGLFAKMAPMMGGDKKGGGFDLSAMGGMMDMLGGFTFLRLAGMISMIGVNFTKEELLDINAKLNKIKAPEKK